MASFPDDFGEGISGYCQGGIFKERSMVARRRFEAVVKKKICGLVQLGCMIGDLGWLF